MSKSYGSQTETQPSTVSKKGGEGTNKLHNNLKFELLPKTFSWAYMLRGICAKLPRAVLLRHRACLLWLEGIFFFFFSNYLTLFVTSVCTGKPNMNSQWLFFFYPFVWLICRVSINLSIYMHILQYRNHLIETHLICISSLFAFKRFAPHWEGNQVNVYLSGFILKVTVGHPIRSNYLLFW